jgi:RecA/RadA recombinase
MTQNIIGFIGPFGAGKTTIAHAVQARINTGPKICTINHFADPIKFGLASMGIHKSSTPPLYRKTAQFVGAAARSYDPDFWVEQFDLFMQKTSLNYPWVLVDDVRYFNEIDYIKDRGGHIVFVDASSNISLDDPARDHESEAVANALHAEHSERHHANPSISRAHSVFLNQDIWVARNIRGKADELATRLLGRILSAD